MAEAWERGLGSRAGAANLPVAFDNCSGDPRRGKRDPLGPEPMMVAVAIRSEKTDAEASSTRRNIANVLLLRHRLISSIGYSG